MSPIQPISPVEEAADFLRITHVGTPFDENLMSFLGALSRELLLDSAIRAQWPDAAAFGSFLRPSSLRRYREKHLALEELSGGPRVPIGRVLQFAPANVEIIAFYTWAIAALCGCQTVVRLSSRRSEMSQILLRKIIELSAKYKIQPTWRFVDYPRENRLFSEALSEHIDLLVIWGGDEAVKSLRKLDIPAHARVLPFPDRESVALIKSDAYGSLGEKERDTLAKKFLKDVTSFSQQACSSPKYLIWVCRDTAQSLQHDFVTRVERLFPGGSVPSATELSLRRKYIFRIAATSPESISLLGNHVAFVFNQQARAAGQHHPGHGVVSCFSVATLQEASRYLRYQDQTIAQFGFSKSELREWITLPKSPQPQRVVDLGEASNFSHIWDGKNFLYEFTRAVPIDARTS